MKKIFTILLLMMLLFSFGAVSVVAESTESTSAETSDEGDRAVILEILNAQVDDATRTELMSMFDESLARCDISTVPMIPMHLILSLSDCEMEPEDIIKEWEHYGKRYIVLDETPYSIFLNKNASTPFVTMDDYQCIATTSPYMLDILTADPVSAGGQLTEIFCFADSSTYSVGIIVYYIYESETIVNYYSNYSDTALTFSESDFKLYVERYYDFISSYDQNYDAFGRPLVGHTTFKAFYNSGRADHPVNRFPTKLIGWMILAAILIPTLIAVPIIIVHRIRKKKACG